MTREGARECKSGRNPRYIIADSMRKLEARDERLCDAVIDELAGKNGRGELSDRTSSTGCDAKSQPPLRLTGGS